MSKVRVIMVHEDTGAILFNHVSADAKYTLSRETPTITIEGVTDFIDFPYVSLKLEGTFKESTDEER
jgi:hypothetical protein